MPAGTVHTDTMVIPRRESVRTEFFNDFLVPQTIDGLINAIVLVEDGRQSVVTFHGDSRVASVSGDELTRRNWRNKIDSRDRTPRR